MCHCLTLCITHFSSKRPIHPVINLLNMFHLNLNKATGVTGEFQVVVWYRNEVMY